MSKDGGNNLLGMTSRRGFMQAAAGGCVAIAAPRIAIAAQRKVTFQLDWIAYGRHAPYYVALEKGFYSQNGLDVRVEQGTGAVAGFRYLAAGHAQFIFQDIGSMIAVRSRDSVEMKALACVYQKAPHTVFYIKGQGIEKPKDLEGKKIAFSPGDSPKVMFPAFAAANGIDESKISWLSVDPNSKNAVLLNHNVDAMITYIFTLPVLQKAAQGGDEVETFVYSDWGVQFYANAILALDDFVAKNPDTCRNFVKATMQGVNYTLDHPEDAVSILKKYQPQLDEAVALKEIPILRQLALTDDTKKSGLGTMTLEKMRQTEELAAKFLGLSNLPPAEQLFTNEFVRMS